MLEPTAEEAKLARGIGRRDVRKYAVQVGNGAIHNVSLANGTDVADLDLDRRHWINDLPWQEADRVIPDAVPSAGRDAFVSRHQAVLSLVAALRSQHRDREMFLSTLVAHSTAKRKSMKVSRPFERAILASTLLLAPLLLGAGPPEIKRSTLTQGLIVESVSVSIEPPVAAGDGIITLVRIDPAHFLPRLLTAEEHGSSRTAAGWAREFGLAAVINASMFLPGGKSTGLMVDGTQINNGRVNPGFGAFFAFDPTSSDGGVAASMFGRGCPEFDLEAIRRDYRVVVQNYRMLNCQRRPIMWKDPKIYSVAAVAVDRDGWIVLIHSRTPYRMREFNTMIADPRLGLTAAMFVEGGPEASLFVGADDVTIEKTGSWETGFNPNDSNSRSWRVPNVIGFVPRETE